MNELPRRLFHYCCDHSVAAIVADGGTLRPHPDGGTLQTADVPGIGPITAYVWPLVWLTDLDVESLEDADVLGLGNRSGLLRCNRTAFRFVVPRLGAIESWSAWADRHALEHSEQRRLMELAPGCDPARWFVSSRPISGARLVEAYA